MSLNGRSRGKKKRSRWPWPTSHRGRHSSCTTNLSPHLIHLALQSISLLALPVQLRFSLPQLLFNLGLFLHRLARFLLQARNRCRAVRQDQRPVARGGSASTAAWDMGRLRNTRAPTCSAARSLSISSWMALTFEGVSGRCKPEKGGKWRREQEEKRGSRHRRFSLQT